jgi:hypothetical protein
MGDFIKMFFEMNIWERCLTKFVKDKEILSLKIICKIEKALLP